MEYYKPYYKKINNHKFNTWTHFINIPINDEIFIASYSELCEELNNSGLKNFYPEILQKKGKIHMTICVLELSNEENIIKVDSILKALQVKIKQIIDKQIIFNFEKFQIMGKNINEARVIYAKMIEDDNFHKLEEIIHLIIESLENEKIKFDRNHIIKQNGKYKIKLHMTIFNVLFLNKFLKKQKKKELFNIDAEEIMEFLKEKKFPSTMLDQINFSKMREDPNTKKYELLYSYNFY